MVGFSFSCIMFVVAIACYIASKQCEKGTGGRVALEISTLVSTLIMVLSACAGAFGV